ncbi:MAG: hypothetical protein Q8877_03150, partial [Sweet potato little leaf phytoplasma]|nr:hypothetical protein [Sweet potato little leaf phytoplasma]
MVYKFSSHFFHMYARSLFGYVYVYARSSVGVCVSGSDLAAKAKAFLGVIAPLVSISKINSSL